MTAIDFPSNPSLNDEFTASGRTWIWNGSVWNSKPYADDVAAQVTQTIVDSAPATLDTLNELAAALGDDENFATTVTNALAGKASTTHTHAISDVTDLQTSLDGKAALSHSHNASAITYTIEDKSANYTIVATDEGKVIRSTGSAITVTVADVFAIGEVVTFTQYGAGQITFTPNGGVTLHSVDSKRKTNKQYSTVQLMKTAAATYLLFGDIAA